MWRRESKLTEIERHLDVTRKLTLTQFQTTYSTNYRLYGSFYVKDELDASDPCAATQAAGKQN